MWPTDSVVDGKEKRRRRRQISRQWAHCGEEHNPAPATEPKNNLTTSPLSSIKLPHPRRLSTSPSRLNHFEIMGSNPHELPSQEEEITVLVTGFGVCFPPTVACQDAQCATTHSFSSVQQLKESITR